MDRNVREDNYRALLAHIRRALATLRRVVANSRRIAQDFPEHRDSANQRVAEAEQEIIALELQRAEIEAEIAASERQA